MTEAEARQYLKLAVEEMRKSVAEPREDGKATPAVGAVLLLPDKEVVTGHRGELRHGDHAEFTVLERKCGHRKLDDSVLFVTLEPCAPGARNPPKTACAERIFNARIKEVWIGIEDPDPAVAKRGFAYLQRQGIDVHVFPKDFQQEIQEENGEFLEQALARAAAVVEPAEAVLSPLDVPVPVDLTELSEAALDRYKLKLNIDDEQLHASLLAQGLLVREVDRLEPTGFCILLFGSQPRARYPQAGVIATIEHANGDVEHEEFAGPLIEMTQAVESWLRRKVPNIIDRSQMERTTTDAIPFEGIREGIVNALVHRDYSIEGAKVQLRVTPEVISISSPGAPEPPVTLEQLSSFTAPTLSRNPKIHHVFQQMELAEEAGLGMRTMQELRSQPGGVVPTITFNDPYVVLSLHASAEAAATEFVDGDARELLTADELRGWELLVRRGSLSAGEYATARDVSTRTALRHLKRFAEVGLAQRQGSGPATRYVVRSLSTEKE